MSHAPVLTESASAPADWYGMIFSGTASLCASSRAIDSHAALLALRANVVSLACFRSTTGERKQWYASTTASFF